MYNAPPTPFNEIQSFDSESVNHKFIDVIA